MNRNEAVAISNLLKRIEKVECFIDVLKSGELTEKVVITCRGFEFEPDGVDALIRYYEAELNKKLSEL